LESYLIFEEPSDDENASDPRSLGYVFAARGHEVRGVGDGFPSGSPDIAVLAAADRGGAVVISRDNDWKQLVRRQKHGERGQFQRAHRILINCVLEIRAQAASRSVMLARLFSSASPLALLCRHLSTTLEVQAIIPITGVVQ